MTAPTTQRRKPINIHEFAYEYAHFIGYGRGHKWACQQLNVDPCGTRRRLADNDYGHLIPAS